MIIAEQNLSLKYDFDYIKICPFVLEYGSTSTNYFFNNYVSPLIGSDQLDLDFENYFKIGWNTIIFKMMVDSLHESFINKRAGARSV